VVRASCEFEYDTIVVSKDIFVEEELEETHLEEPSDEECVEVMPHDLELVDPVSIECPPNFHSYFYRLNPIITISLFYESFNVHFPRAR